MSKYSVALDVRKVVLRGFLIPSSCRSIRSRESSRSGSRPLPRRITRKVALSAGERQFLVWREDAPGVRLGCQVLRRRGRGLLQGPHRQRHGQNQVVVIAFSPRRVGVVARSGYLVAEVLEFRGEGLGLRQLGSDLEL